MTEYLLKNGADPGQKLFTDGSYDEDGYEDWLLEHLDIYIFNGDRGDVGTNDLEIAALLMHYGLDQWPGGMCIDVDKENRTICGHSPRMMYWYEVEARMILWTMQPLEVWKEIQETGVYRCDPARNSMPEFTDMYEWLIRQMEQRIGPPPVGVTYPVWAWYMQNGKHSKPDLRTERWGYGPGGEEYVCIEFEIPDDQALLSDFDVWHIVLCNGLIAESEEEDNRQDTYYDSLTPEEQKAYKDKNWERVFDITPLDNHWIRHGSWVQATVWELRKEMIRRVRFFITGKYKHDP